MCLIISIIATRTHHTDLIIFSDSSQEHNDWSNNLRLYEQCLPTLQLPLLHVFELPCRFDPPLVALRHFGLDFIKTPSSLPPSLLTNRFKIKSDWLYGYRRQPRTLTRHFPCKKDVLSKSCPHRLTNSSLSPEE
jgi:hypothetical protein